MSVKVSREQTVTGNILCDTTASISPATSQGVRSSNNLLIKEPSTPDLTRNECASENTNEEAQCDQVLRVGNETSHGSRNGAAEQETDEDEAGPEAVT